MRKIVLTMSELEKIIYNIIKKEGFISRRILLKTIPASYNPIEIQNAIENLAKNGFIGYDNPNLGYVLKN